MSDIKKEIVTTLKWTWLICVASTAIYVVVPKLMHEVEKRPKVEEENDYGFIPFPPEYQSNRH